MSREAGARPATKRARSDLTAERLREVVTYDPETGLFRWRVNRAPRAKAGDVAGAVLGHNGRVRIKIDGHLHLAHRLAWLYVRGRWPRDELDHIDRNPLNNAIGNLREASRSQNARNRSRRRDNGTGITGVSFNPRNPTKPYLLRFQHNGKRIAHSFASLEEAAAERKRLEALLYGSFAPKAVEEDPDSFSFDDPRCGDVLADMVLADIAAEANADE
jgi:hypothetical protein